VILKGLRLLLVEDDPTLASLFAELLADHGATVLARAAT